MFYNAMRSSGVRESQAKLMYFGVYKGGPRWVMPDEPVSGGGPSAPLTEAQLTRAKAWIDASNPSLEDLERAEP